MKRGGLDFLDTFDTLFSFFLFFFLACTLSSVKGNFFLIF